MANMKKADLEALGSEATQDFLQDHVPLNESISKIASREDLAPEEVQRVVEFANQGAYHSIWKVAGAQKTIEFPRADADVILGDLNKQAEIAPRELGFHKAARLGPTPVPGTPSSRVRAATIKTAREKLAGVKAREFHEGTPMQRMETLLGYGKIARDKIASETQGVMTKKAQAEEECAAEIREILFDAAQNEGYVDGPRGGRAMAKAASTVLASVKSFMPSMLKSAARLTLCAGKSINPAFELDYAGLAELCKEAAPIERNQIIGFLSTPDVPVAVINGNHRVFQLLNIVHDCDSDLAAFRYNLVQADDDVRYVAKTIRESAGLPAGSRTAS